MSSRQPHSPRTGHDSPAPHALLARLRGALSCFTWQRIVLIALGAAILTFGIHNIHQRVDITEGGVIGFVLLANHWLNIPPSLSTPVLDITCYLLAFRLLGGRFILLSAYATTCVSLFYRLWESLPPLLPDLGGTPLLAALLGGAFVGVGVGLIVRQGGSSGGDDALALAISHLTGKRLSFSYLFTDLSVLALSLSYIPVVSIAFSLVTVFTSSFIIDFIKDAKLPERASQNDGASLDATSDDEASPNLSLIHI